MKTDVKDNISDWWCLLKRTLATLLTVCIFPWASSAITVEIVASGSGMTSDAATKAALRSAVEQVVGQLVDANTLVANEEVVSEKILTYSGGYVEGYEAIKEPVQGSDGLFATKIKARVKKTELVEKLRAENVTQAEVSGTSLFAQMTTKQQQAEDAGAILTDDFKDIPVKFLTVAVANKPDGTPDLILNESTGEVSVNIVVQVNMAAYDAWANGVISKLDRIADVKHEALLGSQYNDNTIRTTLPPEIRDATCRIEASEVIMGIESDRSPDRKSAIWRFFKLRGIKAESVGKMLWMTRCPSIVVEARMTDGNGRMLGGNTAEQNVYYSSGGESIICYASGSESYRSGDVWCFAPQVSHRPSMGCGVFSVYNYGKSHRTGWELSDGGSAVRFQIKLGTFTPEQIKAAASIKCTIK